MSVLGLKKMSNVSRKTSGPAAGHRRGMTAWSLATTRECGCGCTTCFPRRRCTPVLDFPAAMRRWSWTHRPPTHQGIEKNVASAPMCFYRKYPNLLTKNFHCKLPQGGGGRKLQNPPSRYLDIHFVVVGARPFRRAPCTPSVSMSVLQPHPPWASQCGGRPHAGRLDSCALSRVSCPRRSRIFDC